MTRHDLPDSVALLVNRPISADELREAIERPLTESEREEILSLSCWFCRRYPTPLERLAYVRQAYRRWHAAVKNGERVRP